MRKRVVHFGAGALGRGLVIPTLVESGYEVVLVDPLESLVEQLNHSKEYILEETDAKNRYKPIPIVEAISPLKDKKKLEHYLTETSIVTTSVRRENLIHVAQTLAETWGKVDGNDRVVICAENIEHVGSYFSSLLIQIGNTMEEKRRMQAVCVPGTLVDRICAISLNGMNVTSESYYEFSVDGKVLNNIGISLISSVSDLERDFVRKRLLLNTYADAISFLAMKHGKTYLYEAAESEEIHTKVLPYIELLWSLLETKYKFNRTELVSWSNKYRERLSNPEIPRTLETVARNLWDKLTLNERFVWPLLQLMEDGIDIEEGVKFISYLISVDCKQEDKIIPKDKIIEKIKVLWSSNMYGTQFFEQVKSYVLLNKVGQ